MDAFRREGVLVPPEAPSVAGEQVEAEVIGMMQIVPPPDSPLLEPHNTHWDANGISLCYRNGKTILLRTFYGIWFAVTITTKLKSEEVRRTSHASDDDSWVTKELK
jgi:hypothetical protein